jgi:hypothetical protein
MISDDDGDPATIAQRIREGLKKVVFRLAYEPTGDRTNRSADPVSLRCDKFTQVTQIFLPASLYPSLYPCSLPAPQTAGAATTPFAFSLQ